MSESSNQPRTAVDLAPGVWAARGDVRFSYSRASGPGGQAVNKLSTRVQLRIAVSAIHGLDEAAADRLRTLAGKRLTQGDEVLLHAETSRSQADNRQLAIERLRDLVATAMIKPKVRRKKKPTRAMVQKRLEGKRRQSQKKQLRRQRGDRME